MLAELTAMLPPAPMTTVLTAVAEQEPLDPVTVYDVVIIGVTTMVAVVAPVFHVYVEAPLAVMVAEVPAQVVAELAATVGVEVTVIVAVLSLVQLLTVPLTVYVVVDPGLCEIPAELDPVFHVYDVAPLAVSVAVFPEQILAEFTLMVGVLITVTVVVLMFEQLPVEPVTV